MKNTLLLFGLLFSLSSCSEIKKSNENPVPSDTEQEEFSKVTLFLTSSGMDVSNKLIPMLPFKPKGKTIHYITTASVHNGVVPEWTENEIKALEEEGFNVQRVDLSILKQEELELAFEGCDLFWVGGGNTLYLLQEVRKSGFDNFVTQKIAAGVPYVGVSAGSIILGPDLEFELYASKTPELDSYEGLNLFPFAPYVHFDAEWTKDLYKDILKFSLENDKAFITLRDNQFIYVTGEKWQVIDVE